MSAIVEGRTADQLAARLTEGWRLIDAAVARGDRAEADRLTEHWLKLLGRYREAADQGRQEHAPPATTPVVAPPAGLPLAEARWLADELVSWLGPACERVTVAGSIRRQRATVKDIELVAIPRVTHTPNLLGEPQPRAALDDLLATLIPRRLRWAEPRRNGAKYKRFFVPSHGVAVDLFLATRENYGNIVAIRTGSSSWSRLMVTPRSAGGLLPDDLRQRGGYLWRGEERLSCPEEADFFAALGLAEVPLPPARDGVLAKRLAAVDEHRGGGRGTA